jgi:hypothetical protein
LGHVRYSNRLAWIEECMDRAAFLYILFQLNGYSTVALWC